MAERSEVYPRPQERFKKAAAYPTLTTDKDMKLYTADKSELMEVSELRIENGNLMVVGTIMGAMPTEAVLTPSELRKSFRLINFRIISAVIGMLFAKDKT